MPPGGDREGAAWRAKRACERGWRGESVPPPARAQRARRAGRAKRGGERTRPSAKERGDADAARGRKRRDKEPAGARDTAPRRRKPTPEAIGGPERRRRGTRRRRHRTGGGETVERREAERRAAGRDWSTRASAGSRGIRKSQRRPTRATGGPSGGLLGRAKPARLERHGNAVDVI